MTAAAGVTHLRAEFARALRKCTPAQRIWLRKLPEHDFKPWGCGLALGINRSTISRMLVNPAVMRAREIQDQIAITEYDITERRVLGGYAKLEAADIRKAYKEDGSQKPVHELDDATAYAMSERQVDVNGRSKVKFHDKHKALEAMSRVLKIAPHRHELTGKDGTPLVPETPKDIDLARRIAFILAKGLPPAPENPSG